MPKTNRMSHFMTNRAAIPTVGTELNELFATRHPDRGRDPSFPSVGVFLNSDVVGRRCSGELDEVEIGKGGPLGNPIAELLHLDGSDRPADLSWIESVIDVAA